MLNNIRFLETFVKNKRMYKVILLLITTILAAISLVVTLICIIIAFNEKDLSSLVYFGIILSIELIILINTVVELFKLD